MSRLPNGERERVARAVRNCANKIQAGLDSWGVRDPQTGKYIGEMLRHKDGSWSVIVDFGLED